MANFDPKKPLLGQQHFDQAPALHADPYPQFSAPPRPRQKYGATGQTPTSSHVGLSHPSGRGKNNHEQIVRAPESSSNSTGRHAVIMADGCVLPVDPPNADRRRQPSESGYNIQQRFPSTPYAQHPSSQQPTPMQYPSYQQQQPMPAFPSSQYQPYQPPPPPQPTFTVVQMPATPYMPYQDQRQPQQGVVVQQPKPRLPVKTSFKFDVNTLGDNHFYIALCLLICVIVCFNPLGLTCTIPALVFAWKAARANEQDSYEEARKYHKRAQFCNIGTGAAIVTVGVSSVGVAIYLVVFFVTLNTSSTV